MPLASAAALEKRQLAEIRLEDAGQSVLAVHAEAEARERDAELRGRDVAILARRRGQHVEQPSREAIAGAGALLERRPRRRDQRELRRDEQRR